MSQLLLLRHQGAVLCALLLSYQRIARCFGHSSYIRHIDWAANSRVLQSSCGAYELLYFEASSGKQVNTLQASNGCDRLVVVAVQHDRHLNRCGLLSRLLGHPVNSACMLLALAPF